MEEQKVMVDCNTHQHQHMHCHTKNISWGAILAGAFIGFGLMFLLNIFSLSIGLSVFPTTQDGSISLAVGGMIGAMIGVFVSMFVAGWTAGYVGRAHCHKRNLGVMYGFTTWCLTLILTMILASHVGHYIMSYSSFISNPSSIMLNANQVMPIEASQFKPTHMLISLTNQASTIAIGAFVVFILLATGALGACFGGHYGMTCKDNDDKCCC